MLVCQANFNNLHPSIYHQIYQTRKPAMTGKSFKTVVFKPTSNSYLGSRSKGGEPNSINAVGFLHIEQNQNSLSGGLNNNSVQFRPCVLPGSSQRASPNDPPKRSSPKSIASSPAVNKSHGKFNERRGVSPRSYSGSPRSYSGSPPSNGTTFAVGAQVLVDRHYAGAKFSDPPNPTSLPKPPSLWLQAENNNNQKVPNGEGLFSLNSSIQQLAVMPLVLNPKPKKIDTEISSPTGGIKKPIYAPVQYREKNCTAMTNHLKLLLKVQG